MVPLHLRRVEIVLDIEHAGDRRFPLDRKLWTGATAVHSLAGSSLTRRDRAIERKGLLLLGVGNA
jgi:hypothetical protein